MRVLVTGSSGQLGEAIAAALAGRHEVVGMDLSPGEFTSIVGSVVDRNLVFDAMRGIDAVVHSASLHAAHLEQFGPRQFIETNIHGTMNLLDAAAEAGVSRFVYTSTTSVYGRAMEDPDRAVWVTEDLPPQPRDIYDITKLAAEQLCAVSARTHGMTAVSLRVSRFFAEAPRLVAIYRLYRGVDVRDAADAHVLALKAPIATFDIFNISARPPFSRDQLTRLKSNAASVLKLQFPWIEEAFARRTWELPTSIDRVYVTEKAERLLNYQPQQGIVQLLQECPDLDMRRLEGFLF